MIKDEDQTVVLDFPLISINQKPNLQTSEIANLVMLKSAKAFDWFYDVVVQFLFWVRAFLPVLQFCGIERFTNS